VKKKNIIEHCGCVGLSYGFELAGFKTLFGICNVTTIQMVILQFTGGLGS
jgi:hypothetical protein